MISLICEIYTCTPMNQLGKHKQSQRLENQIYGTTEERNREGINQELGMKNTV